MIFSLKAAKGFAVVLLSLEYKRCPVLVVVYSTNQPFTPLYLCLQLTLYRSISQNDSYFHIVVKAVIMSLCKDPATTANDHLDQFQEYTVCLRALGYSYD